MLDATIHQITLSPQAVVCPSNCSATSLICQVHNPPPITLPSEQLRLDGRSCIKLLDIELKI